MIQANKSGQRSKMILGAHVSAAGGILKALDRVADLDVQAFQIHPSSPQTWAKPKVTDQEAARFKAEVEKQKLGPIFFHNIFLINFASELSAIWHGSITATVNYLELAGKMDVAGVITHLGSTKGNSWDQAKKRVIDGFAKVAEQLNGRDDPPGRLMPKFIIETSAGSGNVIGDDLHEVAEIFTEINQKFPCSVCFDTAHVFESGRPIHKEDGLEEFLTEFDSTIGLKNLIAVHLNDSKTDFNSKHDRHENIGQGQIGADALARIINHPKLAYLPFILEVPGFAKTGPDRKNIEIVQSLIK